MEEQKNIEFDLGSFIVYDYNALKKGDIKDVSMFITAKNVHTLFQKLVDIQTQQSNTIHSLPEEQQIIDFSKGAWEVDLPKPTLKLPRRVKLPQPKKKTKWDKFSKEKGIKRKRRFKKIFDEVSGEWVPRWGPGSIKKLKQKRLGIIEQKDGEDPSKQARITQSTQRSKQKLRELKNKL